MVKNQFQKKILQAKNRKKWGKQDETLFDKKDFIQIDYISQFKIGIRFLVQNVCFILLQSNQQRRMDTVLRQKMTQLASKCQVLQKNGKFTECIDIMEQIVGIKKNVYGMDHPEFDKSAQKLCEYLNIAAMQLLQKQKFDKTLDYLRKAQLLTRNSIQFKATTYNNLACYYRRTGKVRTALSYLIQALELQLKMENPKTLADTHLNLCAVLSQLDRHQDALQHSMLSIILLQDQFLQTLMPKARDEGELNDQRLAVMAIAYHNLGVEFQHLKRFDQALKIYNKSLKLSKQYLSTNEQLIRNLTKVVNSATQQVEEQKKHFLQGKKNKIDRDLSETKRDIYKDLSKTVERYRHLPKIKFNSKEHASLAAYDPNFTINQQSIDSLPYQPQYNSIQKTTHEKNLYPKKGATRYNKPFAETPVSRSQMDSQLKVRETMRDQGFTNRRQQQ